MLLAGSLCPSARAGGDIRLFGTVEFRATLKSLPNWVRVIRKVKKDPGLLPSPSLSAAKRKQAMKRFEAIRTAAGQQPKMETIKQVNRLFNMFPYRLDFEVYGVSEYWATPREFIKQYGDCEDYSITKFYALKELGFDPDSMRIVALEDTIRGIGHAVLVVYLDGNAFVLDNMTDMVLPHTKFGHYLPKFSVNEKYRWSHIKAGKK